MHTYNINFNSYTEVYREVERSELNHITQVNCEVKCELHLLESKLWWDESCCELSSSCDWLPILGCPVDPLWLAPSGVGPFFIIFIPLRCIYWTIHLITVTLQAMYSLSASGFRNVGNSKKILSIFYKYLRILYLYFVLYILPKIGLYSDVS